MSLDYQYDGDLRLAHAMADRADEVTLDRFQASDLRVESKPDMTPVTDADRAAERLIRSMLLSARRGDAIRGEEYDDQGESSRVWVIDPIDGTKNYLRGVPVWATLIGLIEDGEAVLGLVSAPALHRRWFAAKGEGAWMGRSMSSAHRIRVSQVTELAEASFSCSSLGGWEKRERLADFLALTRVVWRTRGYGDFWSYMLVAEGAVDIAAEPELALHDMAALAPIVTEAGGRFTDTSGQVEGPFGGDALASNALLHPQVLAYLGARMGQ
ncbi:MAG: histidinol-phosphatase [Bifidobacteriaceae bacterium]|jgi:histidinol-phosphatase|nr:histidinol-phosphatase [Bifidobacteriaceae bacterium]